MTTTPTTPPPWLQVTLFILFAAGLSALTYPCPGTSDATEFQTWMVIVRQSGLVTGYTPIADYPPIGIAILYLAGRAAFILHLTPFTALKLSIDAFQLTSVLIIRHQTKSWLYAALTLLFITPFGALLGYIDVFYLPFILLGLIAINASRPATALTFFTVATLIKWQPAILCPLIFLYAIHQRPRPQTIIPAIVITVATILIFHPTPIIRAFAGATSDPLFSGQAFNLDWIVTGVIEATRTAGTTLSPTKTIHYLITLPPPYFALSKTLFWLIYAANFASFALHKKTQTSLLLALLAAYAIQFTFNTGIHENHAFLIMILALQAYAAGALNPLYLLLTATLAITNILAFYGLNIVTGPIASLGTIILSFLQLTLCIAFIAQSHAVNRQNGRLS